MKIALAGSAGTGRTTIARKVAEVVNHPALTNLAKPILKDYGFQYGMGLTVEQFLCTPERQNMLFENKSVMESHYDDFVTDRSWIDLASYAIQGMHEDENFDITSYVKNCQKEALKYDAIVHIPWGRQPLVPDGTRTTNPWFQLIIDSIIFRLAVMWNIDLISLPENLNNEESVKWIVTQLQISYPTLIINEEVLITKGTE
jgi:hypothetical protein